MHRNVYLISIVDLVGSHCRVGPWLFDPYVCSAMSQLQVLSSLAVAVYWPLVCWCGVVWLSVARPLHRCAVMTPGLVRAVILQILVSPCVVFLCCVPTV